MNSAFAVSNTVAVGQDAGNSITSGDRNTFVGRTAGSTANGGNNVTCIGYNAEPSASNANDEITLGDNSVTALRIPGLTSGALSGTVLTYNGTNLQMAAVIVAGAAIAKYFCSLTFLPSVKRISPVVPLDPATIGPVNVVFAIILSSLLN